MKVNADSVPMVAAWFRALADAVDRGELPPPDPGIREPHLTAYAEWLHDRDHTWLRTDDWVRIPPGPTRALLTYWVAAAEERGLMPAEPYVPMSAELLREAAARAGTTPGQLLRGPEAVLLAEGFSVPLDAIYLKLTGRTDVA